MDGKMLLSSKDILFISSTTNHDEESSGNGGAGIYIVSTKHTVQVMQNERAGTA